MLWYFHCTQKNPICVKYLMCILHHPQVWKDFKTLSVMVCMAQKAPQSPGSMSLAIVVGHGIPYHPHSHPIPSRSLPASLLSRPLNPSPTASTPRYIQKYRVLLQWHTQRLRPEGDWILVVGVQAYMAGGTGTCRPCVRPFVSWIRCHAFFEHCITRGLILIGT